jgi:hypothetical protein
VTKSRRRPQGLTLRVKKLCRFLHSREAGRPKTDLVPEAPTSQNRLRG